ncbi:family 43 glycosylhydrolase [Halosimplex sp. J119]
MTDCHDDSSIDRRSVLKGLGAGALGVAVTAGASGTVAADPSSDHYHNPLYEPHFPDPTILDDGGTYYAYGTNMNRENDADELLVPVLSSTDLVNWSYEGEAFTSRPGWTYGSVWAPDIHYYDGEYAMFYSLSPRPWESGEFGIGLATADTPTGPFTDHGQVVGDNDTGGGTIDAYFVDQGGTPHMFWGSFQGIYVAELSSDLQSVDLSTQVQVAGTAYEGTIHLERNGYHYLFLSTGSCCDGLSSTYEIEVGRADSFTGPYYDQNGTALMDRSENNAGVPVLTGNDRFPAPGHGDVTTFSDRSDWLLYHAYDSQAGGFVDGVPRRVLMVDRIEWDDNDWPVVACDGTPSTQAQGPGNASNCGSDGGDGGDDGGTGGPVSEGTYHLTNVNSGKLLEVADAGTAAGDNVQQFADTGHACQDWDVTANGDGTYAITNVHSGLLLEVANASTSDGANVQQYSDTGHACQDWNIVDNGDGTYRLENAHSGSVADVEGSATSDGANVIQWPWTGGANQRWTLDPV